MITNEVYVEIEILRKHGMSLRAIAKEVGCAVNTVRSHLAADALPRYQRNKLRETKLSPFHDYLRERQTAAHPESVRRLDQKEQKRFDENRESGVKNNPRVATLRLSSLLWTGCPDSAEYAEKGTRTDRPELKKMLEFARAGDTIIVWKLDRLGRSLLHLITVVNDLNHRRIGFQSLTDNIDTSTTSGRFFFNVIAAMGEMERDLIAERTKAGIDAARRQGRIPGRKRSLDNEKLLAADNMLKSGMRIKDIAKVLNVSIPTLYRYFPSSKYQCGA